MKKFEHLIDSPLIEGNRIVQTYSIKKEAIKPLFGKEKIKENITADFISEVEYLDEKGKESWELVTITKNSFDGDMRTYYFKREIS